MRVNFPNSEEISGFTTLLSKSTTKEMFLYLAVSESAVSRALIQGEGMQKLVYYVSHSLNGP